MAEQLPQDLVSPIEQPFIPSPEILENEVPFVALTPAEQEATEIVKKHTSGHIVVENLTTEKLSREFAPTDSFLKALHPELETFPHVIHENGSIHYQVELNFNHPLISEHFEGLEMVREKYGHDMDSAHTTLESGERQSFVYKCTVIQIGDSLSATNIEPLLPVTERPKAEKQERSHYYETYYALLENKQGATTIHTRGEDKKWYEMDISNSYQLQEGVRILKLLKTKGKKATDSAYSFYMLKGKPVFMETAYSLDELVINQQLTRVVKATLIDDLDEDLMAQMAMDGTLELLTSDGEALNDQEELFQILNLPLSSDEDYWEENPEDVYRSEGTVSVDLSVATQLEGDDTIEEVSTLPEPTSPPETQGGESTTPPNWYTNFFTFQSAEAQDSGPNPFQFTLRESRTTPPNPLESLNTNPSEPSLRIAPFNQSPTRTLLTHLGQTGESDLPKKLPQPEPDPLAVSIGEDFVTPSPASFISSVTTTPEIVKSQKGTELSPTSPARLQKTSPLPDSSRKIPPTITNLPTPKTSFSPSIPQEPISPPKTPTFKVKPDLEKPSLETTYFIPATPIDSPSPRPLPPQSLELPLPTSTEKPQAKISALPVGESITLEQIQNTPQSEASQVTDQKEEEVFHTASSQVATQKNVARPSFVYQETNNTTPLAKPRRKEQATQSRSTRISSSSPSTNASTRQVTSAAQSASLTASSAASTNTQAGTAAPASRPILYTPATTASASLAASVESTSPLQSLAQIRSLVPPHLYAQVVTAVQSLLSTPYNVPLSAISINQSGTSVIISSQDSTEPITISPYALAA